MWGSTGLFYRPFLNGKYGPIQLGTDKDVCIQKQEDVPSVYKFLSSSYPKYRWSVFSGEK